MYRRKFTEDNEIRNHKVSATLSDDENKLLEEFCRYNDLSKSDFIRAMIHTVAKPQGSK